MLTAKEARKISKYECKDLPVDILINDIDKYIKSSCENKEIKMNYMVDGTKYTYKTVKKAVEILKNNGYIVKICEIITNPNYPNRPNHIELNIRWW